MNDPLLSALTAYGAPGLVVMALLIVIRSLWNALQTKITELFNMQTLYNDKITANAVEVAKTVAANAVAMDRAASTIAANSATIENLTRQLGQQSRNT